MIVVRLMGGHSNQLFQYAIGRSLAQHHNTELILDLSWFHEAHPDSPRYYELDCYPLNATTVESLDSFKVVDPRQHIRKKDALLKKLGLSKKIWMYYEQGQGFHANFLSIPNNSVLIGFWQTEKYFTNIRNQLLQELQTRVNLTAKNSGYLEKIKSCDSISLHVRRGDYVTNKNYAKFHGILDLKYYTRAITYLQKNTSSQNLQLFVFSNDLDWCKKNLKSDLPITFIEGNKEGSDDMNLMKYCQHFIMANSSFSWWGAWLAQSSKKIVIAPKKWFQDKATDNAVDIVPEEWIRL